MPLPDYLARYLPVTRADLAAAIYYLETLMSEDRDLLAQLARDLTALAGPIGNLISDNAAKAARIAELEGSAATDTADDLAAIQDVKVAYDGIAAQLTAQPEIPDVEPLPEPEPPSVPVGG